jgi:CRISPR-associated protein Csb2
MNFAHLSLLDACLARMTYFGRAESITLVERVLEAPSGIEINCELVDRRERGAVPVLCVKGDMTAALASDETALRSATVPPGAVWRYAMRPARPAARRLSVRRTHKATSLIQFAIGAAVELPVSATTTVTNRLRGRVLREALTELNDGVVTSWREASRDLRARVAELAGKDEAGEPLEGYAHARYLIWYDEDGRARRLFVHRARPFEPWEHDAILRAGQHPLGWSQAKSDGWTLRMVPMDSAVPPPRGFDGVRSCSWSSVSPFVPARYFLDSRGRVKEGETPREQINKELARRGWPQAEITSLSDAGWVRVHAPQRQRGGATNNSRRSFRVTLRFAEPVRGPVLLGHSSFFGLGVFAPHETADNATAEFEELAGGPVSR